jgi:DNA-binding protein HU-beta
MTKADLIEAMAKDAGITKAAAGAVLDSFVGGVSRTLKKKDGKVTLVGFGKAANVVKFKAGKQLKSAI